MPRTGFIYHSDFLKHDTGPSHPERPERLSYLWDQINSDVISSQLGFPAPKQIHHRWLTKIHTVEYIENVKAACGRGGITYLDGDTPISENSFEAALLAAGAVHTAIDKIMEGELDNCFCAVRPPGHHAERDRAMGFCLFNNVALGAVYLLEEYKLNRIAIIDWDVHHGNGTQNAFYESDQVYYLSLHQYPYYPGSGSYNQRGSGKGEGYTLNIPLSPGCDGSDYDLAFTKEIIPSLNDYKPEFILISAGFDAHRGDPLASMKLSDDAYYRFTRELKMIAGKYGKGRVVSVLEGGYDLGALVSSVKAHLKGLIESL